MKAIILAAGKGTRMRPLTYLSPKPMIPLIRTPVMETIIKHLAAAGIKDIMINTSYMSDTLQNYFHDGQQWGVNLAYSFEGHIKDGEVIGEALGSAGGIKRIQEFSGFFDEPFLVLCGDAFVDFDVQAFAEFHRARGAMASLLVQEVPQDEVSEYGVVAADEQGLVTEFQEKPLPEDAVSNKVNTGIYLFEPDIIQHIPINQEYDIGGELFPYLAANQLPLYAMTQEFTWLDIGRLADYFSCQEAILNGEVAAYPVPGRQVAPGVWMANNVNINLDQVTLRGPIYVGPSCRIDDGATIIGPTIIGANCHICTGAQLTNVFTGDYLRFPRTAVLEECIIDSPYMIAKDGAHQLINDSAYGICDARCQATDQDITVPALANIPPEHRTSPESQK